MKKLFIAIVAATVAASVHAQAWKGNLRLSGTVVDQKSGEPVKDATVKLRTAGAGPDVKADAKGKWAVLGLGSGNWDIDVDASGYATKQLSVVLKANDRIPPMKIELEPVAKVDAVATEPSAAAVDEVKIGGVSVTPDIAAAVEAGNTLVKESKFKEAVEQYEKAYPSLSSNLSLKVALARAYYGAGDHKKAIVLLDEAYKADPTNPQNAMLLGELLLEDGQLERGKAVIEALPAEAINDPMVMVNIGILMMNKKQPAAAQQYFTKAIAMDPSRAESYYFRGLAAVQAGKAKDAKADLQKTIELAPDSSEAKEARELLKQIK